MRHHASPRHARTRTRREAEALGALLSLHVYGERWGISPQELTGACLAAAADVFYGRIPWDRLREVIIAVPPATCPIEAEARDRWVIDTVRGLLAALD